MCPGTVIAVDVRFMGINCFLRPVGIKFKICIDGITDYYFFFCFVMRCYMGAEENHMNCKTV